MSKDAYYTPSWLAKVLVDASDRKDPRRVADFAAGDGALLAAAESRWPRASILAADLCETTIRRLRKRHKKWKCTKCDFLEAQSRSRSTTFRALGGSVDLVFLNPPFSCRGGTVLKVDTQHGPVVCGRALAFVLTSIPFLANNGEIITLLPSNVLRSEKDQQALEILHKDYCLQTKEMASDSDFEGCRVSYVIACISKKNQRLRRSRLYKRKRRPGGKKIHVKIVRGTSQMHDLPPVGRTLVHTTDMRDHQVELNGHCGARWRPSVVGPSVMLPRVGAPRIDKACLYLRRKRVTLSDCVFGLQCNSADDARWLLSALQKHEEDFRAMYTGTCAPYATHERLRQFLECIGCSSES